MTSDDPQDGKSAEASSGAPTATEARKDPRKGFTQGYIRWFETWMPESFVICLGLTVIVAVLALIFTDTPIFTMSSLRAESDDVSLLSAWVGSFWNLLAFAMQMTILLATGNAVASSPPAKRFIGAIARFPKRRWQYFAIGVFGSAFFGFFHWGLGMMAGIVLGKEMLLEADRRGIKLHFPLFVAAIFLALIPASAGMSGAAVLFSATPGYLQDLVPAEYADETPSTVPMSDSVFTAPYIGLLFFSMVIAVCFTLLIHPKKEENISLADRDLLDDIAAQQERIVITRRTPAERANASSLIMFVVGGAGLLFSAVYLFDNGIVGLDLNSFNFLFLTLGMVLCARWGPEYYAMLVREGIKGTWGIILQFPFYAGIFGLIVTTGLAAVITNAFTSISSPATWPLIAFIYSGILNIAVPSGGSKFVIEAPYIIPTSLNQGSDLGLVLQAYQMGDATTNMLIPFWALPYLAHFRIRFSRVVAYTLPVVLLIMLLTSAYMLVMA